MSFEKVPILGSLGIGVVCDDEPLIEARITTNSCGQLVFTEQFRNRTDTYPSFASAIYGREINRRDYSAERFVGKHAVLGLGFGMGAAWFNA